MYTRNLEYVKQFASRSNFRILKNIKITYKNKTDSRIIVPYLTPSATLEGVDLSNKYDFANMDEIKVMILQRMVWRLKHKVLKRM